MQPIILLAQVLAKCGVILVFFQSPLSGSLPSELSFVCRRGVSAAEDKLLVKLDVARGAIAAVDRLIRVDAGAEADGGHRRLAAAKEVRQDLLSAGLRHD